MFLLLFNRADIKYFGFKPFDFIELITVFDFVENWSFVLILNHNCLNELQKSFIF